MSVLGHAAAGLVAARGVSNRGDGPVVFAARALGFAALGLLPDVDLALQALAPDVDLFAHRGPSHSLAVAMLIGAIAAAMAPAGGRARLGLVVAAVVGSHGVLDALGTARLGVELLWPFTEARFLAPWQVLPNVDLTRPLPGIVGVLLFELALFTPAWVYVFWPRGSAQRRATARSRRSGAGS